MDEQGVPLNKGDLFIDQGVGSSPIFHVYTIILRKKVGFMLATMVSVFSVFGLATLLAGCFFVLHQMMNNEARVKVPVKREDSFNRK